MSKVLKITTADTTSEIDSQVCVWSPSAVNYILINIRRGATECDWDPWVEGEPDRTVVENIQDEFAKFIIRDDWYGSVTHYVNEPTNPTDDTYNYDITHQYSIQYTGNIDSAPWDKIWIDEFGEYTKNEFAVAQSQTIDKSQHIDTSNYPGGGNGSSTVSVAAKFDGVESGAVQCQKSLNIRYYEH